jgi:elongation factor Ts
VTTDAVKRLRERTGAGVMDCKRALEQADGNEERAIELLREKGLAGVEKRAGREARQGLVDAYIHAGGRIGALIEVNCETDFVARGEVFRKLVHELAMQVAATAPQYIGVDELPVGSDLDPAEVCLLAQPYIRDPKRTVNDLVVDVAARTGENIVVRRFARFELGAP